MTDRKEQPPRKGNLLFRSIARFPYLFCIVLPVVFAAFTAIGFTREDFVEESVGEIWIPTSDQLAKNKDYTEKVGVKEFVSSSIAAMAMARDGVAEAANTPNLLPASSDQDFSTVDLINKARMYSIMCVVFIECFVA